MSTNTVTDKKIPEMFTSVTILKTTEKVLRKSIEDVVKNECGYNGILTRYIHSMLDWHYEKKIKEIIKTELEKLVTNGSIQKMLKKEIEDKIRKDVLEAVMTVLK